MMDASSSSVHLPSTKTLISTAASIAATAMLVRSLARDFVPHELRQYLLTKFHRVLHSFSNEVTLIIDEFDGLNKNQLFTAAEIYLSTLSSPSTRTFRASLPEKEKKIHVSMGGNEELTDKYNGTVSLKWRMISKQTQARYVPYPDEYTPSFKTEVRYLEFTFHKKHKNQVIDEYLPYILERSKTIKETKKTLKLHTLKNDRVHGPRVNPWTSVNLDHPANFETLAMDEEMKRMIVDDLDRFVKRRELYRKVGKAWKRGYLLFGPPGTGKSSLIAAMANYLNFDVYDLELTDVRANSDLRKLVISTANRSILVVEDIDASIDLSDRKNGATKPAPPPQPFNPYFPYNSVPKVTLSGLLNFIDGLWSSCGDERIIIFTTNHKEKLDPALLRPGRMDVHIHMSYCTASGLKMLASNYLGVINHPLISEAEGMISSTKVTPAEVGEQLLKSDDPDVALQGLKEFLEQKKESERLRKETLKVNKVEIRGEEGELKIMEIVQSNSDGLKELIKMAKQECPADVKGRVVKKDEAVNALRILMDFLEIESTKENVKADDAASLGSQDVVTPLQIKE